MSDRDPDGRQPFDHLVDGGDGHDAVADRARQLLRRIAAPPLLSPTALARIRMRVESARPSGWTARFKAALALASLVGAAGAAAVMVRLVGDRAPVAREVAAATCATTRLAGEGHLRMALIGPGAASIVPSGAGPIVLRAGRLAIESGDGEVVVDAGHARVIVGRDAMVEIEVRDGGAARVAAFLGETSVIWREQTVEIAEGSVWSPDGVKPLAVERIDAVEGALNGKEPQTCPGAAVLAPPSGVTDDDAAPPPSDAVEVARAAPLKPRKIDPGARPAASLEDPADPADPAPPTGVARLEPSDPRRVAVAPTVAPAPASPESALHEESRMVGDAQARLNRERDPAGALEILDRYQAKFPDGRHAPDALQARVRALRALSRGAEALALLDGMTALPTTELGVLRGELRAQADRCRDALTDFDAALASLPGGSDARGLEERALYGRASCRSRAGQPDGARADLTRLLERFPNGRFADAARRALE